MHFWPTNSILLVSELSLFEMMNFDLGYPVVLGQYVNVPEFQKVLWK